MIVMTVTQPMVMDAVQLAQSSLTGLAAEAHQQLKIHALLYAEILEKLEGKI